MRLPLLLLLAAALAAEARAEPPVIEAATPAQARAGGNDFIVRVRGTGFTASSIVRWNGADRVTAAIGPDQLSAMIPAADVAQPGEARLTVYDPAGGESAQLVVPVRAGPSQASTAQREKNPLPVVLAFSPRAAVAGSKPLTLVVRGRGFTPFSVVRWRGAARETRFVSASELEARLLPSDLAVPGTGTVTVRNPLPGGGSSRPELFAVRATASGTLERPRVYPNPWRAGVHDGLRISFENLALRSRIKIFTVGGSAVKTIPASEGSGEWDLTADDGKPVGAGAYVYLITDGNRTVEGKLKISR